MSIRNWALAASLTVGASTLSLSLTATTTADTATVAADTDPARIGEKAPDFTLTDHAGKTHTLSDYTKDGKVVVLEWFAEGCPFVKRHYEKYSTMADTYAAYKDKGVVWFAINSAHVGHPYYGNNAEVHADWEMHYPILEDASGKVGKAYGARTTPHMFIINDKGVLVYAGGIDNDPRDRMDEGDKVNYVKQALEEVLAGETVTEASTSEYGCSVKYAKD